MFGCPELLGNDLSPLLYRLLYNPYVYLAINCDIVYSPKTVLHNFMMKKSMHFIATVFVYIFLPLLLALLVPLHGGLKLYCVMVEP